MEVMGMEVVDMEVVGMEVVCMEVAGMEPPPPPPPSPSPFVRPSPLSAREEAQCVALVVLCKSIPNHVLPYV